jgi:mono/diheme cytochrome c family protein/glucose/arabinose dehydrogenase
MAAKHGRGGTLAVVIAGGLLAVTLSVVAQSPQTPPPTPQPPPGTEQNPPTAGASAEPGQPAGRGRGTPMWEADFSKKVPVPVLTPAEEAKRFWLPPGYKLEPVLADPDIEEPAQIAFDGNGRMFVLELRGYMQNADADGELDPVGRISVHEDKDNDGTYETHGVFVDRLVFPRFVTPIGGNAILTKESNADEVWKYTDTDNDGVADKKELFTTGLGRLVNVEHQESGFVWGLDNWIYSTVNAARIRWTPTGVLREPTGTNSGQWGVTQDNYGKMWFQAGASGMPGYFQFPVQYGAFANRDQFEPDLNITWGAPVLIADMQGGMNAVRMPDGSLARATGAAGNDIYRGDRLPKDLVGEYLYGEVVARIVRRLHPVKTEGLTQLQNVYPLSEFIRSTDPLFRPVDLTTAPDGTLYITDMYRGIIQESQWSGPGTYLRKRIDQYGLDKIVRHGRIWRLTYDGMGRRTTPPRMLAESAPQLVGHLGDSNGWWRDTAQQLLVLKQDKSVVPALKALTRPSADPLARIHALWTLEGLGAADAALTRSLMQDADPQMRIQAIRASETAYKSGDKSLAADLTRMTTDADPEVVLQAVMTINTLKVADAKALIASVKAANQAKGVQLVASAILTPPTGRGGGGGGATYTAGERDTLEKGREIYSQVCFACHGEDGTGTLAPGTGALGPSLVASPRVLGHHEYVIKTLLHGLTGPLSGTAYPDVMVPMGQNDDAWIAAIASYVRNAFGNRATLIGAADVARVRAATVRRKQPWAVPELEASLPRLIVRDTTWKATASHNPATAMNGFTIQPWSSGAPQQAGMWFQVEWPEPLQFSEVEFESGGVAPENVLAVPGAPTRSAGGGGRRGAPGTPAPAPPPPPQPGYPRAYQVQISMDGTAWQSIAEGRGTGVATRAGFPPVRAKYVRITLTASAPEAPPWTVQRLRLFESGGGR